MAGPVQLGGDGRGAYLFAALRYVALNPVRARLVERAENWPWSSTRALLAGRNNHVVTVAQALDRTGDFCAFLSENFDEAFTDAVLRKAEGLGRPIGTPAWLEAMAKQSGKPLFPGKRGPKPKRNWGFPDVSL